MANPYFRFKQFTVWQHHSSLRVNTDSCLLGGWVAHLPLQPARILDVGTGTGVLALMLAQAYPCTIDAVELDAAAYAQACENIAASKWQHRINVLHADIGHFTHEAYELIICNPPYFSGSLQNPAKPNAAKHQCTLDFTVLSNALERLLTPLGEAWLILPQHELNKFRKALHLRQLYLHEEVLISKYAPTPPNKSIVQVSKQPKASAGMPKLLHIKTSSAEGYSPAFVELLRPYYLHL